MRLDAYTAKVKLLGKLKNTVTRAVAAHRAAMFLEETEKYNEGILRKVRKAAQAKAVEAAGGYFCALWAKLGDLDYYATMMKLRHYAANIPCSWCREGESDAIPWNGFRPTASWIHTTYSSAQFEAAFPGRHRILKMTGVTIHTIYPDYMHCKFLGVDMYFLGSVLTIMTFMLIIPRCASFEERLQKVWTYCKEWYGSEGVDISCRYTRMTINMFTKPDGWRTRFPRLKG